MTEQEILEFAWWLTNNLNQYPCDETAHFEGRYLEEWKRLKSKV